MHLIRDLDNFEEIADKFFFEYKQLFIQGGLEYVVRDTGRCLYYGVFDGLQLVGYYWLMRFDPLPMNFYQGYEFHIDTNYQHRGIGMNIYDQILMEDRLAVVSDLSHTPSSSKIWDKLMARENLRVGLFDHTSKLIRWNGFVKDEVYTSDRYQLVVSAK